MINRRHFVLGVATTAASTGALAEAYPDKPIHFINTFPAGGPSDILARDMALSLQTSLHASTVVENRPGAGGNLGADFVAKSAPDGSNVLIGIDTTFTVNPHIYKNMPFKLEELKPVMILASSGLLVGTYAGSKIKTMQELIATGKKRTLNFSSGSNGSPGHLAMQLFKEQTGIQVQHVPYKGNSPAVTAIMAGEVDAGVLATPGMLPQVRSGRITALAVTSKQRSALAPEIPTVAELGLKNLEIEVLYVAMVPAATPEPIMQVLQKAFAAGMQESGTKAQLKNLDMRYEGLTGADAVKRLADLSQRYGQLIKSSGMKVE